MSTLTEHRQLLTDGDLREQYGPYGLEVLWDADEDIVVICTINKRDFTHAGRHTVIGWHSARSHVFGDPWIMIDRCPAYPRGGA